MAFYIFNKNLHMENHIKQNAIVFLGWFVNKRMSIHDVDVDTLNAQLNIQLQ